MIKKERISSEKLDEVSQWPVWEKEISEFDHDYTEKERFYIVEGVANLSTESGLDVTIGAGDFVTVKNGIVVTWAISAPIKKHFKFYP